MREDYIFADREVVGSYGLRAQSEREPPICTQIPVCRGAIGSALYGLICAHWPGSATGGCLGWPRLCAGVLLDRPPRFRCRTAVAWW
jgi:hypothetical protein